MTDTESTSTPKVGLRDKDFIRLWKGETISKAGNALTVVVLPLIALQYLNANTFMMAVLQASIWLPWLLVGLPAGIWADRVRARPLMITCDLIAAGTYLTIPIATWLGLLTIPHLIIAAVIAGGAGVFFTAAYNTYIPFLVAKKDLFQANSRLQATESGAAIAGPPLGGFIAVVTGAVLGLLVDCLSFLISALYLRRITVTEPPKTERGGPRRPILPDIIDAGRFIFTDPYLRVITVNVAVINFCLGGVQALTLVFLLREIGLGPWAYSAMLTAIALGGVLGSVIAPVIAGRLGAARALIVLNPITGTVVVAYGLTDRGIAFVIAFTGVLLWSAGAVANTVISASFRQAYCPYTMLGRVAAFSRTVQFGMLPVGSIVAGLLGTVLNVRSAIWLFLGLNVVVRAVLFIGPLKRSRHLPTERVEAMGAQPADLRPVEPTVP